MVFDHVSWHKIRKNCSLCNFCVLCINLFPGFPVSVTSSLYLHGCTVLALVWVIWLV